jgi:hypothetical protein
LRPPVGEKLRENFQEMRSPLADLVRMDAEVRGNLGDCFLPLDGFQGDCVLSSKIPQKNRPKIPMSPCGNILIFSAA